MNWKQVLLWLIAIIAFLFLIRIVFAKPPPQQVCFCHNVNNNPHTICTSDQGQINGHMRHVRNGTDYLGECREIPSPTPTEIPTPTDEPTPTPSEEPTPTEAPKQESQPEQHGAPFTEAGLPGCADEVPTMVQDIWYSNYQVAGGEASLTLNWGTNPHYARANIVYGEKINEWTYGVTNIENNGSFTIGGLKPGQTYWFQVNYQNNCQPGPYSRPVDP